jgi:flagellar L-ring protein precursor FlgH
MENGLTMKKWISALLLTTAMAGLSACNAGERLASIGEAPAFAPLENPASHAEVKHVSFPQPEVKVQKKEANSLWQSGSRAFFKDQRAGKVGDILTVVIEVSDKAEIKNETKRSRNTAEDADVTSLMGFETKFNKLLPDAVDPGKMLSYGGKTQNDGSGQISREDKVNLRVAAVVTQILPNGNMVIYGKQQMNVNYDQRELKVTGVIRPEDISSSNSVSYDQIAEARIAYGGRGQIMDVQQPRYGTQLMDVIFPF